MHSDAKPCTVVTAFTEDIKNLDVEVGDRMLRGWCLSLFRCMGQITEEHPRSLKNRFHFLTTLLAEKVNSLADSEGSRDPEEVFQWHCALDMAIRLYRQSPNIIDKQMFEALHARSVETFRTTHEEIPGYDYRVLPPRGISDQLPPHHTLHSKPELSRYNLNQYLLFSQ